MENIIATIKQHTSKKFMSIFAISYERANAIFDLCNGLIIASLAVGLIATFFAIKMAAIRDRFTDERTKEIELKTAQANERTATLEKEAESLKKDSAAARLELEQIKEKQRPRTITPEQRSIFSASLIGIPKGTVSVYTTGNDAESAQYAEQFRSLLKENGFEVGIMSGIAFGATFPKGVTMFIKNQDTRPAFADGLLNALRSIDPSIKGVVEPKIKWNGDIFIAIGGKL